MRKLISALILLTVVSISAVGQNNVLDGAYVHENAPTLNVVPYPYLRESDVMWSKMVWRVIDLSEKLNLPLKYPTRPIRNRKSLINVLVDGMKEGTLTAYSTVDDEFTTPITFEGVQKKFGASLDTQIVVDPDPPYASHETVVAKDANYDKVIGYRIKEEWFFDKQRSVMDVRIIGIAPIVYDEDEFGNIRESGQRKALLWVYFPEARTMLVNAECFNLENDAERRTFDDIFMKRIFSTTIIKVSNVYDRNIGDYRTGIDALLESNKLKADIFNLEHDLWEY